MELQNLTDQFRSGLMTSFRNQKDLADRAMAQLSDDQFHVALDANTNSIAVITRHVGGNLRSRWTDFLSSDGEKPWRNRDEEFTDTHQSRDEILHGWEAGWDCLMDTLAKLQADDFLKTVQIRGEDLPVVLAAQRSLAHTSYHVGQIVLIARILAGDIWQVLTIPRGGSGQHNQRVWGEKQYDR